MKCNHCKKIIPVGEEIIIDKEKEKKYLHEECLTKLEKEEKEQKLRREENTKKFFIKVGFGLTALCALLVALFLYLFKKQKDKSDPEGYYEATKFLFFAGGVILLATGAFWITSSYWTLFAIPFIALLI
jgi:hypothetical protein